MAYKVLGQVAPAASTNTDVYVTPSDKSAVCSTISVCNRGTVLATYRIAVRPAGAPISDKHYIAYDLTLPASSSDLWTIGVTLAATDVVTFYSTSATMSCSIFGEEL